METTPGVRTSIGFMISLSASAHFFKLIPVTFLSSSLQQHPELQPDPLHPGPFLRRAQVTSPAVSSKFHLQVPQWIQYSTLPFACYGCELNQSLITPLVSCQEPCLVPFPK